MRRRRRRRRKRAVVPREEGLAAGIKLADKVLVEDDEAEKGEEERVVKSLPDRKTVAEE